MNKRSINQGVITNTKGMHNFVITNRNTNKLPQNVITNTLPPCQTCSIHPQVVQSLQHNLRQSFIQYNECQALKLYPIQVFLKGFVCFQQLIRKFHKQLKKFLRYSKQCVHSYYIESDKKQNASNVGSSKCFRVLLTDTVKCPIKL